MMENTIIEVGSTKQMLRGNALTNFLMSKAGLKWDAATIANIGVDDLDQESYRAGYIESWGRGIQRFGMHAKILERMIRSILFFVHLWV